MEAGNWVHLNRDAETGMGTIRAHFIDQAYEPHWRDSCLVVFTAQGVQQFHRRQALHGSCVGQLASLRQLSSQTMKARLEGIYKGTPLHSPQPEHPP